jgi:hypothetical protein
VDAQQPKLVFDYDAVTMDRVAGMRDPIKDGQIMLPLDQGLV